MPEQLYFSTLSAGELIEKLTELAAKSEHGLNTPVIVSNDLDFYQHAIELDNQLSELDDTTINVIELNVSRPAFYADVYSGVKAHNKIITD